LPELLAGYLEAIASDERKGLYDTAFELAETIDAAGDSDVIARAIELALARPRAQAVRKLFRVLDRLASASEPRNSSSFAAAVRNTISSEHVHHDEFPASALSRSRASDRFRERKSDMKDKRKAQRAARKKTGR
jgi:hypothetical protein